MCVLAGELYGGALVMCAGVAGLWCECAPLMCVIDVGCVGVL